VATATERHRIEVDHLTFRGGVNWSSTVELRLNVDGHKVEVKGQGSNVDAALLDALGAASIRINDFGRPEVISFIAKRNGDGFVAEVTLSGDHHQQTGEAQADGNGTESRLRVIAMAYMRALNRLI